jgi:hypothetical protein
MPSILLFLSILVFGWLCEVVWNKFNFVPIQKMEDSAHSIFHPFPRKIFVTIGNILVAVGGDEADIAEAIEPALVFGFFCFDHGNHIISDWNKGQDLFSIYF